MKANDIFRKSHSNRTNVLVDSLRHFILKSHLPWQRKKRQSEQLFPQNVQRLNCCGCRPSTAGGNTASPSLCPATRRWWWSTAMTTTQTCSRYGCTCVCFLENLKASWTPHHFSASIWHPPNWSRIPVTPTEIFLYATTWKKSCTVQRDEALKGDVRDMRRERFQDETIFTPTLLLL